MCKLTLGGDGQGKLGNNIPGRGNSTYRDLGAGARLSGSLETAVRPRGRGQSDVVPRRLSTAAAQALWDRTSSIALILSVIPFHSGD